VGNLPAEPNSFIGRERDTAELVGLLARVRALTLCGPGGIGKTRLALRLAAGPVPDYTDGAWFVDLAGADNPGLVVPLVAAAMGVRQERDRQLGDTLTEALRPRSMLLILDTCEHLVDACAELVQQLLANCAGLQVIATSREPLRIRGEAAWRVPPLGLPPWPMAGQPSAAAAAADASRDPSAPPADRDDYVVTDEIASCEAVRLFAERAAAARPGFTLEPGNIAAVVAICRTLDGMPLAIELAAARMRALSAGQIAARLADRFALLASGDRTAPHRQQTLRAAVDWSYDLLTEAEQTLLRRLSVFYGWSLEMAEQVCSDGQIRAADVLDLLTALIDKSLVNVDWIPSGHARYRLLDTVRDYAAAQSAVRGEASGLRTAHRDYMLALVEQTLAQAFADDARPWSERVAVFHRAVTESANFRAALACSAERGEAEQGLRLCIALRPAWMSGGDATDGTVWLDRFLTLDQDVSPDVRGRALAVRAELAFELQDYQAAGEFANECREVSRAGVGNQASALRIIALLALLTGHADEAEAAADAAIAAARAAADEFEASVALIARAAAVARQGRLDCAQRAYEAALGELGENRGWGRAYALYGLGRLAMVRQDGAAALRHYSAALALHRQVGDRSEMARCLAVIGQVAQAQGNPALARTSFTESLQLSLAAGQRLGTARGLLALSACAAADADLSTALKLVGASLALHEAIGEPPSPGAVRRADDLLALARGRMGAAAAEALLLQGRAMSPHAAARLGQTAPGWLPGQEAQAGPGRRSHQEQPDSPGAAPGAAGTSEPPNGGLTARELEIAAQLARGLTNQAIARELFISPSTVARHIANIFTKLGCSSRAQVAAWAAGRPPPREP
jgi:predicted ATPase/DNA-binding CsgD family transcriptional regulator/tetratricopeptide (TPR) repeat protein